MTFDNFKNVYNQHYIFLKSLDLAKREIVIIHTPIRGFELKFFTRNTYDLANKTRYKKYIILRKLVTNKKKRSTTDIYNRFEDFKMRKNYKL